jgi:hypothetical protein
LGPIKDIQFDKVNRQFVYALGGFLRFERIHRKKKRLGNNTTVKYLRNIFSMINHAITIGLATNCKNSFANYKSKVKEVENFYLSEVKV